MGKFERKVFGRDVGALSDLLPGENGLKVALREIVRVLDASRHYVVKAAWKDDDVELSVKPSGEADWQPPAEPSRPATDDELTRTLEPSPEPESTLPPEQQVKPKKPRKPATKKPTQRKAKTAVKKTVAPDVPTEKHPSVVPGPPATTSTTANVNVTYKPPEAK